MEMTLHFLASPVQATLNALPVITAVGDKFQDEKPFKDLGIIALLHLRPTLVATVRAWNGLGTDPQHILIIAKEYNYTERDIVLAELHRLGVKVVSVQVIDEALQAFLATLGGKRFMVVEDGGHIMPHIYDHPRLIGGIEQTTKGLRRVRAAITKFQTPLLSLPDSKFKKDFEPDHVARASVESIERLLAGHAELRYMSVAIIGAAGTIGVRVAEAFGPKVPEVVTFDCAEPRDFRIRAYRKFKVASSAREAIAGRDLVVGCTGECTLRGEDIGALKDGAILASTGSERTEFPLTLLEFLGERIEPFRPSPANTIGGLPHGTIYTLRPRGKSVILLNDGEPVNFSHLAPPEPAVFDLVMATVLAGSVELACGRYTGRHGLLDVFDSIVERHQLDELFLALYGDIEGIRGAESKECRSLSRE
jgi:adenosylhomocysteinase